MVYIRASDTSEIISAITNSGWIMTEYVNINPKLFSKPNDRTNDGYFDITFIQHLGEFSNQASIYKKLTIVRLHDNELSAYVNLVNHKGENVGNLEKRLNIKLYDGVRTKTEIKDYEEKHSDDEDGIADYEPLENIIIAILNDVIIEFDKSIEDYIKTNLNSSKSMVIGILSKYLESGE